MKVLNDYAEPDGFSKVRQFFLEKGQLQQLKKNEYFIRRGQFCRFAGLVQSGSFRYLNTTSEGKDQVVGYSFPNDFVLDYPSLRTNQDSIVDIQAIKNSTILVIPYQMVHTLYEGNDMGRQIAESLLAIIYGRLLSLYCDSPQERYLKLVKNHPEMFNLLSLKEISSYLKMTPETLSRIRRRVLLSENS